MSSRFLISSAFSIFSLVRCHRLSHDFCCFCEIFSTLLLAHHPVVNPIPNLKCLQLTVKIATPPSELCTSSQEPTISPLPRAVESVSSLRVSPPKDQPGNKCVPSLPNDMDVPPQVESHGKDQDPRLPSHSPEIRGNIPRTAGLGMIVV